MNTLVNNVYTAVAVGSLLSFISSFLHLFIFPSRSSSLLTFITERRSFPTMSRHLCFFFTNVTSSLSIKSRGTTHSIGSDAASRRKGGL